MFHFVKSLFGSAGRREASRQARRRSTFRPTLEVLEGRGLLSGALTASAGSAVLGDAYAGRVLGTDVRTQAVEIDLGPVARGGDYHGVTVPTHADLHLAVVAAAWAAAEQPWLPVTDWRGGADLEPQANEREDGDE